MSPERHLVVAGVCSVAGLVDVVALGTFAPRWWAPPPAMPRLEVVTPPAPPPPDELVLAARPPSPEPVAPPVEAAPDLAPPPPAPVVIVSFASEAIDLRPAEQLALAQAVEQLKGSHVLVEGHADPSGRPEGNAYFARVRARVVAKELERLGLSPSVMKVVGRGALEPLDGARTASGRARNRRVEVWKVAGTP